LPEWLIERGIGETRAALVEDDRIIEARIELEGTIPAGSIIEARLENIGTEGRNAIAVARDVEFLLPGGARGVAQGAKITIEVTRSPIPGSEPWKRPLARLSTEQAQAVSDLQARLGGKSLTFPAPVDVLSSSGWNELIDEARSGTVSFRGGELRLFATPAMTLIDVDGYVPPGELAVVGAREAASAIRRLDIGGSIGIDLPTSGDRIARKKAAEQFDAILPKPFERTAVNGFGFLQLVRPRTGPSLVDLAHDSRSFEARALLRRTAFCPPGPKRVVANPALVRFLEGKSDWLDGLSRQIGGTVELRSDAGVPMSAGYAENV
jgi:ribonuclease G